MENFPPDIWRLVLLKSTFPNIRTILCLNSWLWNNRFKIVNSVLPQLLIKCPYYNAGDIKQLIYKKINSTTWCYLARIEPLNVIRARKGDTIVNIRHLKRKNIKRKEIQMSYVDHPDDIVLTDTHEIISCVANVEIYSDVTGYIEITHRRYDPWVREILRVTFMKKMWQVFHYCTRLHLTLE
jgi:hypothetical protein